MTKSPLSKWHAGEREMPQEHWRTVADLDQPEKARMYAEARADLIPEEIPGPPKVTAEQLARLELAALTAHEIGDHDLLAEAERTLSRVEANPFNVSTFWPLADPAWVKADHEAQIAIGMAR